MIRDRHEKVFFLVSVLALLCVPLAEGQTYVITDLGTLRPGSARVHDINSLGQAVGASGHPHGSDTHAFFWSQKGGIRDLGFLPGGDYSVASAINDSGQVVGTSNSQDGMHAFLWTAGTGLQQLPLLSETDSSSAYAINGSGQIAGASGSHAVIWSGNAVEDLGTLGGSWSEAHGINNAGQVVGVSDTKAGPHAFLWSDAAPMQDLGTLPGDSSSRANRISDQGAVVGASEGMEGVRAFIWTKNAGMQQIGSLQGGGYSEAFGINNLGQVVGQSGSSLGTRAFLWTSGAIADLNDLVPGLPVGVILTGAFSINDKGEIVAFGVINPKLNKNRQANMDDHLHSGPTHVFLLTPQTGSSLAAAL
ncbi:MAG TPA: HAF repeat-containing protein [Candidatus Angelobacter sp.]|nr:HAF repeat-containing protein [Candidatus Angelobacter sp.]